MDHTPIQETDRHDAGCWFLVQLKPGGFARARTNLNRQGFETFMPLRAETRQWAGRSRTEQRPLFPGYLFVRLDAESGPWRKINNTFGVARLVCLAGQVPSRVPPPLIRALIEAAREGTWEPDTAHLPIGACVSLISGPFAGAFARIVAAPEDGRILVLLEMMGQAVRAAVPLRAVEFSGAPVA